MTPELVLFIANPKRTTGITALQNSPFDLVKNEGVYEKAANFVKLSSLFELNETSVESERNICPQTLSVSRREQVFENCDLRGTDSV